MKATAPAPDKEAALVQAVARGQADAIERLYREEGDRVLRFVYRRVGRSLEDAEEITQDTFLSAIKLAPTFDGSCSITGWLYSIARIRITDHFRRQGRDKRVPVKMLQPLDEAADKEIADLCSGSASFEQVLDRIDAARLVDELLAGLNEEEREALLLRYVEQLSVREMATIMQRSEKGVEGLLTRAKNKPRALIERWNRGKEARNDA
jgi:RNA polymerase sigma-70 factor, ECF subfamily